MARENAIKYVLYRSNSRIAKRIFCIILYGGRDVYYESRKTFFLRGEKKIIWEKELVAG